jgi:uncharacterized protein
MDKVRNKALDTINIFINLLKKDNYNIHEAYLFGSFANNSNNEYSDIDLALVSDDFSGDLWEDKKILRNYKSLVSWDLAPLPFRINEFENSIFAKDEIISKGIRII